MKVFGTVKDAANEMPLRGAKISLFIGERELAVLKSDREGKFEHKEAASYMSETLICQVKKGRYNTQEISYKIEGEEVPLNIELVPEKGEEIMKEPSKKWPKIIAGIAVAIVVAVIIYLWSTRDDYVDNLFVGSIAAFAMEEPPEGWLECNGQQIIRTEYTRLFDRIGITFGAGDGVNTFIVPDLRAEFIRGWDYERGIDAGRDFGSFQKDQIQTHRHSDSGHSHTFSHSHSISINSAGIHSHRAYVPAWDGGSYAGGQGWPNNHNHNAFKSTDRGRNLLIKSGAMTNAGNHSHGAAVNSKTINIAGNANLSDPTNSSHGKETRPRNLALMYCIKY